MDIRVVKNKLTRPQNNKPYTFKCLQNRRPTNLENKYTIVGNTDYYEKQKFR